MRLMVLIVALLTASVAWCQQSSVPDVYATTTQFERVVILRFKFGADLLAGLREMVKKENIKSAIILSGAGSVRNYHVHTSGSRDYPPKNLFLKDEKMPADIINVSGFVINGRVHAHITLMDDKTALGGHLEPDTNVYTFAAITLGVLPDSTDLNRLDDPGNR